MHQRHKRLVRLAALTLVALISLRCMASANDKKIIRAVPIGDLKVLDLDHGLHHAEPEPAAASALKLVNASSLTA